MNKKLIVGLLSLTLIFVLGTSAYMVYAHGNFYNHMSWMGNQGMSVEDMEKYMEAQGINVDEMEKYMEEQGVDVNQMYDIMNSGNWDDMQKFMEDNNIDFEQMLPYMEKIHPDLNQQDLQEMYNDCHRF